MQKFITFLIIYVLFSTVVSAKSQYSETLGRIENSLFGIEYTNQSDLQRLDRIEENVYGKISHDNIKSRIIKLSEDISADTIGKEIKPKYDTFADEDDFYYEEKPLVSDSSVRYPIIEQMEQEIFNKTYPTTNIESRLENLEKQTFKKTYSTEDLNSRTERLKMALVKEKGFNSNDGYNFDDNLYSYMPAQNFDYMNSTPKYSSPLFQKARTDEKTLSQLEKKFLKKTFEQDSLERRISRLEATLFNTNFSEDDSQTRLSRLESVYAAQKSSKKYDSFSQHMSTAIQVGTILLMVLAMVL